MRLGARGLRGGGSRKPRGGCRSTPGCEGLSPPKQSQTCFRPKVQASPHGPLAHAWPGSWRLPRPRRGPGSSQPTWVCIQPASFLLGTRGCLGGGWVGSLPGTLRPSQGACVGDRPGRGARTGKPAQHSLRNRPDRRTRALHRLFLPEAGLGAACRGQCPPPLEGGGRGRSLPAAPGTRVGGCCRGHPGTEGGAGLCSRDRVRGRVSLVAQAAADPSHQGQDV